MEETWKLPKNLCKDIKPLRKIRKKKNRQYSKPYRKNYPYWKGYPKNGISIDICDFKKPIIAFFGVDLASGNDYSSKSKCLIMAISPQLESRHSHPCRQSQQNMKTITFLNISQS